MLAGGHDSAPKLYHYCRWIKRAKNTAEIKDCLPHASSHKVGPAGVERPADGRLRNNEYFISKPQAAGLPAWSVSVQIK